MNLRAWFQNLVMTEGKSSFLNEETLIYTLFDWDYGEALKFQKEALKRVHEFPREKIFVCCSHPHVFTLGRGLQKKGGKVLETLVDFDKGMKEHLDFPLYEINRGGGLTFHYPGQWIFYPIINLNHPDYSLKKVIYFTLDLVKKTLEEEFQMIDLSYEGEFLGLWHKATKMASVGIGVEHFVTYHGLALNLCRDEKMFSALSRVNPCGLRSEKYVCLSDVIPSESKSIHSRFQNRFFTNLANRLSL